MIHQLLSFNTHTQKKKKEVGENKLYSCSLRDCLIDLFIKCILLINTTRSFHFKANYFISRKYKNHDKIYFCLINFIVLSAPKIKK